MATKEERHSVNGKLQGYWYETECGNKLYLAQRTKKDVHRQKNAWLFDTSFLDKCRQRGIKAIGVVRKERGKVLVWLTHIDDFFDAPDAFMYMTLFRQRGLPLPSFRIDPLRKPENIESVIKIK